MLEFSRLALAASLALGTTPIVAREVDLLEFKSTSTTEQRVDWLNGGPIAEHPVELDLRQQFDLGSGPSKAIANHPISASRDSYAPSVVGGKAGTWAKQRTPCTFEDYVPTWWLSRSAELRRASYFNTVARVACEHGLPTRLLDAVIAQESGYNRFAISSAGASGMMQIMPGTARLLDLDNPFDPVANIRAGARYLRQQLDRFGRVDLALAAYNAGPERRSLQQGYIPAIPETLNYVRTITTNWARLAELGSRQTDTTGRTYAALSAIHASGYRDVELIRYDGLN